MQTRTEKDSLGERSIPTDAYYGIHTVRAIVSLVTALTPYIGYVEAAQIAKEHLSSGKSIMQIVLEKGLMTKEELDEVFDLRGMTEPGLHR